MLEKLSQLFNPDAKAEPELDNRDERIRVATCVLMLEVAQIDEEFTDDERDRILEILRQRYALSESDAAELMQAAQHKRDSSVDLWKFTNQLNTLCGEAEKIQIVEEVWRVVAADGGIHGHESHFMRQLSHLLNLAKPQVIEAKLKVLEEERRTL